MRGNSVVSRQDVELSSQDMKLRKKNSVKEAVADKSIFRKERKASDNGYSSEGLLINIPIASLLCFMIRGIKETCLSLCIRKSIKMHNFTRKYEKSV